MNVYGFKKEYLDHINFLEHITPSASYVLY